MTEIKIDPNVYAELLRRDQERQLLDEQRKAKRRQYYANNREKFAEISRKHYEKHSAKIKKQKAEYYLRKKSQLTVDEPKAK